jgi:hypothetical protein
LADAESIAVLSQSSPSSSSFFFLGVAGIVGPAPAPAAASVSSDNGVCCVMGADAVGAVVGSGGTRINSHSNLPSLGRPVEKSKLYLSVCGNEREMRN